MNENSSQTIKELSEDKEIKNSAELNNDSVAQNEEDLVVISTLCQDSIIKVANIKWAKKSKRFYLLINRFCWELNDLSKKNPLICLELIR